VTNLANMVEGYRYTGWDLAYTPNGRVMVEGNPRGQFVSQMADKVGRKAKLINN
jgi:hypothetical protein